MSKERWFRYEIILGRDRKAYLFMPDPFTNDEVDRLQKWLDFNREDLKAAEPSQVECDMGAGI